MTERIFPTVGGQVEHTTSLEHAYAQAQHNLAEAEALLAKTLELQRKGDATQERVDQLTRLRDSAFSEVERTRHDL